MNRPSLAALALCLAASGAAAGPVTLSFGEEGGRSAVFTFSGDRTAPDALVIETRRVGNPGADLRIWIDRNPEALLSMILTESDCRFDDAGAACRIEIAGDTPAYRSFVTSFRLGRTAHVEVRNAGVMEMRDDLPLDGFTAAYGR